MNKDDRACVDKAIYKIQIIMNNLHILDDGFAAPETQEAILNAEIDLDEVAQELMYLNTRHL